MISEQAMAPHPRIFWPRTSEVIDECVLALQRPPERALAPDAIQTVMEFESELFEGRFEDLACERGLCELPSTVDATYRLMPAYFLTIEGGDKLRSLIRQDSIGDSEESIAETLYSVPFQLLADKKDEFQQLAGASLKHTVGYYAAAAMEERPVADLLDISLNHNPDDFLQKLTGLVEFKDYLAAIRGRLKQYYADDQSDVTAPRLAVSDMYRDKINAVLAEMYPGLQAFLRQYDAQAPIGQKRFEDQLAKIPAMIGVARAAMQNPAINERLIRRLDYVRNGAAYNPDGQLSPINARIFDDVATLHERAGQSVPEDPVFSPEEVEALQSIWFDAEHMQSWLETYRDRLGIRGWEVEQRSDKGAFSVSSEQEKIRVPGNFDKPMVLPDGGTGVVSLEVHEVGGKKPGHVQQSINAALNPLALRIAASPIFRGKRYTALREPGGIVAEAAANEHFFGLRRDSNAAYAKGLEQLVDGQPMWRAVSAFALSQLLDKPDASDKERRQAFSLAADRTLRLTRFGGRNSQPLEYVEAATVRLAIESLEPEWEAVLLAEATLDPVDILRLHRYGLFNTNTEHHFKPREDPEEIMVSMLKDLIGQHKSEQASVQ